MINALLLALVLQEGDVTVTGHGRRQGGEYDLAVVGKGKGLRDYEVVSLAFRRLVNQLRWADGTIVSAPAEEEIRREATVENHEFVHHERFAIPGDVDVRIVRAHPDGAPAEMDVLRRVFRASSLSEQAHAIGSAAKRFDGALRGVRLLLEDLESVRKESCPPSRKQSQLQKRIDWRRNAYREEIADSYLAASARALTQLMTDIETALDLERHGKDTCSMLASLSGKPFSWDELPAQLEAIEAASLRERALLIVKTVEATAEEMTTAGRAEKEAARALDVLQEVDHAWRIGESAAAYVAAVDGAGRSLEEFLSHAQGLLKTEDSHHAEVSKSLMDEAAAYERRLRSPK